MTPRRALFLGLGLGVSGLLLQLWLLHRGVSLTMPLRSGLTLLTAAVIGIVSGSRNRKESYTFAAFTGFVTGALMSSIGLVLLARNPALAGSHPFASMESALTLSSTVIMGTVLSSWVMAGLAVLFVVPFIVSQQRSTHSER